VPIVNTWGSANGWDLSGHVQQGVIALEVPIVNIWGSANGWDLSGHVQQGVHMSVNAARRSAHATSELILYRHVDHGLAAGQYYEYCGRDA
jgi:hypothetical protein